MPPWKETALQMLPELSDVINQANNPYLLWCGLREEFERAYDTLPRNESLIERIYDFHSWCINAPRGNTASDDLPTCVCVCFLEHIPLHPAARADMPRWLSYQEFILTAQIFRCHLSDQDFRDLKHLFYRSRKSYVQRRPPKSRHA